MDSVINDGPDGANAVKSEDNGGVNAVEVAVPRIVVILAVDLWLPPSDAKPDVRAFELWITLPVVKGDPEVDALSTKKALVSILELDLPVESPSLGPPVEVCELDVPVSVDVPTFTPPTLTVIDTDVAVAAVDCTILAVVTSTVGPEFEAELPNKVLLPVQDLAVDVAVLVVVGPLFSGGSLRPALELAVVWEDAVLMEFERELEGLNVLPEIEG